MLKLKLYVDAGRNDGSRTEASPADGWPFVPTIAGCANVLDGGGMGATRPSVPIRNAVEGLTPPEPRHWPLEAAPTHATGWPRPTPSSGISTRPTPFKRL